MKYSRSTLGAQESPGALVGKAGCNSRGLAGAWDPAFSNKLSGEAETAGLWTTFRAGDRWCTSLQSPGGTVSALISTLLLIFLAVTYLDGADYIKQYWKYYWKKSILLKIFVIVLTYTLVMPSKENSFR